MQRQVAYGHGARPYEDEWVPENIDGYVSPDTLAFLAGMLVSAGIVCFLVYRGIRWTTRAIKGSASPA